MSLFLKEIIVEKIKTFEDYALAMDRIIELMESDVPTQDDELRSLTRRVAEYEGRAVT